MRFLLTIGISLALATGAYAAEKKADTEKAATGAESPMVEVKTNHGTFVIELNQKLAPVTVKNFIDYVESDFYNDTVFHRVISGFVIQGGGFTEHKGKLAKKDTKPAITNEAKNGLKNLRYSLSMARLPSPDSATSQFFINLVDNSSLDYPNAGGHGYAVFGKVVKGQEVIDKIGAVQTTNKGGLSDVPVKLPKIEKAVVLDAKASKDS